MMSSLSNKPISPSPHQEQKPQPRQRRRAPSRSLRNNDFQNSLKSLPENVSLDVLESDLDDSHRASIKLVRSADGGDDGNAASAGLSTATSTCNNGRCEPRCNSHHQTLPDNKRSEPKARAANNDDDASRDAPRHNISPCPNTTTATHSPRRESWKFDTDWDDMLPLDDSMKSSFASQASLYHILDELLDAEPPRDGDEAGDNNDGENNAQSSNSCYRRSLHDILFEDLNDCPSKDVSGKGDSNGDGDSAPKRGVTRQTSASAYKRSIQHTLQRDEDSSFFNASYGTDLTRTTTSSGDDVEASDRWLGHAFGGLALDVSDR